MANVIVSMYGRCNGCTYAVVTSNRKEVVKWRFCIVAASTKQMCHKRIPIPRRGDLGWPSYVSSGTRPAEVCDNKSLQEDEERTAEAYHRLLVKGLMLFTRLETHEHVHPVQNK
jgi:hypothetical protein